jgi:hypothetical protein
MTMYQYKQLREEEQAHEFWKDGVLIASRTEGEYQHILYQLHSFYIELHYQKTQNELVGASLFANTQHLEPYLAQMNIPLEALFISL